MNFEPGFMKRLFMFSVLCLLGFAGVAQSGPEVEADILAIRKIIQTAYVEGLQNEGDTVKINQGFHPGFEMLIPGKDGGLKKFSIAAWKEKIKADLQSGKLPRNTEELISVKFLNIDVSGNAAVAKFEFYVGRTLTYIDYQGLYKFGNDWKIVSKIYQKL